MFVTNQSQERIAERKRNLAHMFDLLAQNREGVACAGILSDRDRSWVLAVLRVLRLRGFLISDRRVYRLAGHRHQVTDDLLEKLARLSSNFLRTKIEQGEDLDKVFDRLGYPRAVPLEPDDPLILPESTEEVGNPSSSEPPELPADAPPSDLGFSSVELGALASAIVTTLPELVSGMRAMERDQASFENEYVKPIYKMIPSLLTVIRDMKNIQEVLLTDIGAMKKAQEVSSRAILAELSSFREVVRKLQGDNEALFLLLSDGNKVEGTKF